MIHKVSKHGLLTLTLHSSLFWMDLFVCMDIHCNPGLENVFHCHYFNIHNCTSDANSTANRVINSHQQLYGFKCKSSLPSALCQHLQGLSLLRTRRCWGEKSVVHSSWCYNIKTIISHTNNATKNKASLIGRCLENLVPVNRCSSLSPSSLPLKLCLLNARLSTKLYNSKIALWMNASIYFA